MSSCNRWQLALWEQYYIVLNNRLSKTCTSRRAVVAFPDIVSLIAKTQNFLYSRDMIDEVIVLTDTIYMFTKLQSGLKLVHCEPLRLSLLDGYNHNVPCYLRPAINMPEIRTSVEIQWLHLMKNP